MKPLVIAIHGILTGQTTASWPDRFDGWCEARGLDVHVEKKEYSAGPFPIWNTLVTNRRLAAGLFEEIKLLSPHSRRVCFVAHSNGTDIALKTVKLLAEFGVRTDTMILVGSVVDPDVTRNGIRGLCQRRQVLKAIAYCSRRDTALGIESWLPWCAYKDLGIRGWMRNGREIGAALPYVFDTAPYPGEVITRRFDGYDHGTYFDGAHIEETFGRFAADLGIDRAEAQRAQRSGQDGLAGQAEAWTPAGRRQ